VTWFTDFLLHLRAPGNEAPLDFFLWHLYSADIEELVVHAAWVKKTL